MARRTDNPLALAVLGLLLESPLHPYEVAATLKERHKDSSFKISTGTLYDVVEALAREGWIAAEGTHRQGRRPERTVYALTDRGREQFVRRLDELLRVPAKEYPRFLAAVSYLGALSPEAATAALRERAESLADRIAETDRAYQEITGGGVPRMFMIELEYARHMMAAERDWVNRIIDEIGAGTLEWPRVTITDGGWTTDPTPSSTA